MRDELSGTRRAYGTSIREKSPKGTNTEIGTTDSKKPILVTVNNPACHLSIGLTRPHRKAGQHKSNHP